jgi:hypothetical protein
MLVEYQKARQEPGQARRRWFEDSGLDLVGWYVEPVLREWVARRLEAGG